MGKKILIVDDEPGIVAAVEFLMLRRGYEVCRLLRERADWRDIKVIMLSARGRDAEVAKGLSLGADLYITKPFSTRDLMARVSGLLDADLPGDAG